jgi:hypothetical protein
MQTFPQADEALIPLAAAAAHALQRLLPEHIAKDERSRDSLLMVADAMCSLIPIYRQDTRARVTQAELALLLQTDDRITRLAVRRQDLETATDSLVASYIGTAQPPRAAPAAAPEAARRGKRRY